MNSNNSFDNQGGGTTSYTISSKMNSFDKEDADFDNTMDDNAPF
jgi:hypothetical protein